MSSDHIYIRNSEYRSLQNEANRANQAEQRLRDIQAQTARQLEVARRQSQQRIDAMNTQINAISNQRIADIKRIRDEFNNNIAQLNSRQQQDIHRLDNRISDAIRDYTNQFTILAQRETDKKNRAEILLTEMSDLLQQAEQFQPEKYRPEQYALLRDQVNRARNCFSDGEYEAARAIGEAHLLQIILLRHNVQRDKEEFLNTLAEANVLSTNLRSAIERLTSGEETNTITYEGETLTRQYDVNYWTEGRFDIFCQQLNQVEQQLTNAEKDPRLGLNELNGIRDRLVIYSGENDDSLLQLNREGVDRHTSQIIANAIARRTCNILHDNGYYPVNLQDKVDENDTQPFETILQDGIGNQIALSGKIGSNCYYIDSEVYASGYDNSDSEDTCEIRRNVHDAVAEANPGSQIRTERRDDCHQNRTPQEFLQNNRARQKV